MRQRCARFIQTAFMGAIAQALGGIEDITVKCVTMDMPENGLPQQLLDETDVLIWWAHLAHNQVSDEVARRVQRRVLDGHGFVALHSPMPASPSACSGHPLPGVALAGKRRATAGLVRKPGHPIRRRSGREFCDSQG